MLSIVVELRSCAHAAAQPEFMCSGNMRSAVRWPGPAAAARRAAQTRRAPAPRQVLGLGLVAARAGGGGAAWRGAPAEVATALLGAFVGGRENDGLVLRRLWPDAGGREAVLRALAAAREAEPKAALRALQMFQARARPTAAGRTPASACPRYAR